MLRRAGGEQTVPGGHRPGMFAWSRLGARHVLYKNAKRLFAINLGQCGSGPIVKPAQDDASQKCSKLGGIRELPAAFAKPAEQAGPRRLNDICRIEPAADLIRQ